MSWARVLELSAPMRRGGGAVVTSRPRMLKRCPACCASVQRIPETETDLSDWQTIDFFTDESLVEDPYPYFDQLREACPVLPLPHLGVVAVTGYDELNVVYRDNETFSSCNSVVGPYAVFPVPLEIG